MIYGPPGWGKTYLARQFKKVLIISVEVGDTGGLMTLADLNIAIARVTTWDGMVKLVGELNRIPGKCQLDGEEFDIVFVDSFSKCGDLWMDAGMKVLNWTNVWDLEKGKDPRRIYSYVAEKGRQGMKLFLGIDAHLVLLCREQIFEETIGFDDKGNKIIEMYPVPEMPGQKLAKELPGDPDATLYCDKQAGIRVFRTANRGKRVARIRVPGSITVPDPILADLDAVIKLMLGDKTALERLTIKKSKET